MAGRPLKDYTGETHGIELVVIPYWDYEKINLNMLI